MKKVIATKDGFFGGNRIRAGAEFQVPDKATGKWFVETKSYKPPPAKNDQNDPRTASQLARRKAEGFVELMSKKQAPEPEPEKSADEGRASDQKVI